MFIKEIKGYIVFTAFVLEVDERKQGLWFDLIGY